LELPTDETVMSRSCPVCANAGNWAVTITAAELRSCGTTPGGS
jgi:hypothetical protein